VKLKMERRPNGPWRQWAVASLSFALILYVLQKFFFSHTTAVGLFLIVAALLAYLVLLLKISDRQAGLALEAECGEWR
jgi:hypothetical protein